MRNCAKPLYLLYVDTKNSQRPHFIHSCFHLFCATLAEHRLRSLVLTERNTLCTFFHNTSQWTNRIVHMHLDRPTSLLFKHHSHPNLQALSILHNSTPTRTHTRQIVFTHRLPSIIPILMLLISLHSTKP